MVVWGDFKKLKRSVEGQEGRQKRDFRQNHKRVFFRGIKDKTKAGFIRNPGNS